jgi:hypothetical protein
VKFFQRRKPFEEKYIIFSVLDRSSLCSCYHFATGTISANRSSARQFLEAKGAYLMWGFMTQSGIAAASVDFTSALSVLSVGLLSALVLLAGIITFSAIRYSLAQKSETAVQETPVPVRYREAA